MVLDLRSMERALAAMVFFDKHLGRDLAELGDIAVLNKLSEFTPDLTAGDLNFEEMFGKLQPADPSEFFRSIERFREIPDREARAAQAVAWLNSESRKPLPEVERFPTHFYEEGIERLRHLLMLRQSVALEHFLGRKNVTVMDLIERALGPSTSSDAT
jgi:hypothetical protein